ncbi:hypothetical protein ABI59_13895 [Acidobacteria bacterium Mor1]|nr:hypothetical protein ABI59_13895 [Acidobacteria bacterium Mor1]
MQRIADVRPVGQSDCTVEIDGSEVVCAEGDTVLHALFAVGKVSIARRKGDVESGAYCGMGVCYCCTVSIDGVPNQRACQISVRSGMRIETGHPSGGITVLEDDA